MYKEIDKEYVTCPFNPSHEVQRLRIQSHIIKCRKNYPDAQLATCYYNYRHLVRAENMSKHLETCLDKIRLEGSRYRDQSVTASTSTYVVDEDEEDGKTESVISFGSDFKKSLPLDTSSNYLHSKSSKYAPSEVSSTVSIKYAPSEISSTVSSKYTPLEASSTTSFRFIPRTRGNALLKTGPRGNLSRYAIKHRRTELQDRELRYLETYDGLQEYEPSSPEELSPVKKSDENFKEDSDEDMQPLPLPKTSSKAFTSLKRSLFEESKNNVPKKENPDKSIGADKKLRSYMEYEDEVKKNKAQESVKPVKSKYVMEYEKEYGEEAEKEYLEYKKKKQTFNTFEKIIKEYGNEEKKEKKHKSDHHVKNNKHTMEHVSEADQDFQRFISKFKAEKEKKMQKQIEKQMNYIQWKESVSTHVVGRGIVSEPEPDRRPGRKNSLLPEVSDLDEEVPKRKNKSKFSTYENSGDYIDAIYHELGVYGEAPPASFMNYRDYEEDSSDTDTAVSSVSSVVARTKFPAPKKTFVRKGEDEDEDEETYVMNASLGRGFQSQKKETPVKSFRGMGRGVLLK